ncbi:SEC-C metal-binding domain-containing protein [Candidatus Curculioniphilus buchneri]
MISESINTKYRNKKIRRNDICPCGSRKKFKYCHGQLK